MTRPDLPPPAILEELDFEQLLAAVLISFAADFSQPAPVT